MAREREREMAREREREMAREREMEMEREREREMIEAAKANTGQSQLAAQNVVIWRLVLRLSSISPLARSHTCPIASAARIPSEEADHRAP